MIQELKNYLSEKIMEKQSPLYYGDVIDIIDSFEYKAENLPISDVVGRSEQLFCDCSQGKGVDIDEDGFPYCIDCQKNVAK